MQALRRRLQGMAFVEGYQQPLQQAAAIEEAFLLLEFRIYFISLKGNEEIELRREVKAASKHITTN